MSGQDEYRRTLLNVLQECGFNEEPTALSRWRSLPADWREVIAETLARAADIAQRDYLAEGRSRDRQSAEYHQLAADVLREAGK